MDKATFATMISDGQVELSKLDADDEQTKKDLGNINLAFHGGVYFSNSLMDRGVLNYFSTIVSPLLYKCCYLKYLM